MGNGAGSIELQAQWGPCWQLATAGCPWEAGIILPGVPGKLASSRPGSWEPGEQW